MFSGGSIFDGLSASVREAWDSQVQVVSDTLGTFVGNTLTSSLEAAYDVAQTLPAISSVFAEGGPFADVAVSAAATFVGDQFGGVVSAGLNDFAEGAIDFIEESVEFAGDVVEAGLQTVQQAGLGTAVHAGATGGCYILAAGAIIAPEPVTSAAGAAAIGACHSLAASLLADLGVQTAANVGRIQIEESGFNEITKDSLQNVVDAAEQGYSAFSLRGIGTTSIPKLLRSIKNGGDEAIESTIEGVSGLIGDFWTAGELGVDFAGELFESYEGIMTDVLRTTETATQDLLLGTLQHEIGRKTLIRLGRAALAYLQSNNFTTEQRGELGQIFQDRDFVQSQLGFTAAEAAVLVPEDPDLSHRVRIVNGLVSIHGTKFDDRIDIGYSTTNPNRIEITIDGILAKALRAREVEEFNVLTFSGDDHVSNRTSVQSRMSLGSGNDTGIGGFGQDYITGGRGDDVLLGRDGNDVLFGGLGIDELRGGSGINVLNAGSDDPREVIINDRRLMRIDEVYDDLELSRPADTTTPDLTNVDVSSTTPNLGEYVTVSAVGVDVASDRLVRFDAIRFGETLPFASFPVSGNTAELSFLADDLGGVGEHRVIFRVVDANGNRSINVSKVFTISEPPAPAPSLSGLALDQNVHLTGTPITGELIGAENLASTVISVDLNENGTADPDEEFARLVGTERFEFDTTNLAAGVYEVFAKGFSESGDPTAEVSTSFRLGQNPADRPRILHTEFHSGEGGASDRFLVTFDRPMDPASVQDRSVWAVDRNGVDVTISGVTLSQADTIATVTMAAPLAFDEHRLTVQAHRLRSADGVRLQGTVDVAFGGTVIGSGATERISIRSGDGSGSFRTALQPEPPLLNSVPDFVATSDINLDGIDDLAVATSSGDLIIYTSSSDGELTRVQTMDTNATITDFRMAEATGDGHDDLIVVDLFSRVLIYQGVGNSLFESNPIEIATSGRAKSVEVANFDSAAGNDLAIATESGVFVIWNPAVNGFGTAAQVSSLSARDIHQGFVDSDGLIDLVVSSQAEREVRVLTNNGDKTFSESSVYSDTNLSPRFARPADITADGRVDIVFAEPNNREVRVLEQQFDGSFTLSQAVATHDQRIDDLVVADFDSDGGKDVLVALQNTSSDPAAGILLNNDGTLGSIEFLSTGLAGPHSGTAAEAGEFVSETTLIRFENIQNNLDYGDAPAGYGTLLADDGARHVVGSLFLGSNIDAELDGIPSQFADGDDFDGVNDEDGFVQRSSPVAGARYYFDVTASGSGVLAAWVDFDQSGKFDANERFEYTIVAGLNEDLFVDIPSMTPAGNNFVRLRLASSASDIILPTGEAADGEVEDFLIAIQAPVNETPGVSLANEVTALREDANVGSRVKVADIVVTDDGLGTNSLSLTGDDAGSFEIDGFQLYLVAGTMLDFESNPSLDVTVNVDDPTVGSSPDDTAPLAITIINVNEPPTVSISTTSGTTSLPGRPFRLLPFATVGDIDAGSLDGYRLDVLFESGRKSYDRLWLLNESGQRLANGDDLILHGLTVGTVIESGLRVKVLFNANASFNDMRAVFNRVEFENLGSTVTSALIGERVINMMVRDAGSLAASEFYTLNVKGRPTIELEKTAGKTVLPGAPYRLLPFATVIDADESDLDGFRADVRIVAGRKSYDRLWLLDETGQRLAAGASIVLSGLNVGTVTENGMAVRVTLNANATLNHLRHLYNRVEYENVGSNPTIDLVGKRVLAMRVIDTDTQFDIAYYNVYVQGRPVINLGSTSGATAIPGSPYRLLPFATVKDIDAASLNGYRVDMYFDAGRKAYDRLWLLGENGQRLNNGDALILNGVTVGTVIESGLRVKVLFNANATLYHARVVYNRIEYENLGSTSDPSLLGTRRLELRVRDVDGNIGSAYYDLDVTA